MITTIRDDIEEPQSIIVNGRERYACCGIVVVGLMLILGIVIILVV